MFIEYHQIFRVVEEADSKQKQIWRVKFKHDDSDICKGYMSTHKRTAEQRARSWCSDGKNEKLITDILFEKEVLDGSEQS